MKLAITTTGHDLAAPLNPSFGRAAAFVIYETNDQSFTHLRNTQQLDAVQGAGIQAASHLVGVGVEAVISGHCGPKAMKIFKKTGIKVYLTSAPTVQQAISAFNNGELQALAEADVEGHWV